MRNFIAITTTLLTAVALAGCGSSKTSAGASSGDGTAAAESAASDKPIDACSLMTADEMTAITTDKVTGVQPTDPGSCNFRSGRDDGVQIKAFSTGGAHQMEIVHKTASLLGGMGQAVAGKGGAGRDVAARLAPDKGAAPAIGDEAVWEANDTLAVRKGDMFVEVSPPLMHDPATHTGYPLISKDEKRTIARTVAEKLLVKLAH